MRDNAGAICEVSPSPRYHPIKNEDDIYIDIRYGTGDIFTSAVHF